MFVCFCSRTLFLHFLLLLFGRDLVYFCAYFGGLALFWGLFLSACWDFRHFLLFFFMVEIYLFFLYDFVLALFIVVWQTHILFLHSFRVDFVIWIFSFGLFVFQALFIVFFKKRLIFFWCGSLFLQFLFLLFARDLF